MTRRLTPAEVGDKNIEYAAHPRTAGPSLTPFAGSAEFLQLRTPRVVPLPEPVEWRNVSARPPGGFVTMFPFCELPPVDGEWEVAALTKARMRERAAEAVLLGGLT